MPAIRTFCVLTGVWKFRLKLADMDVLSTRPFGVYFSRMILRSSISEFFRF